MSLSTSSAPRPSGRRPIANRLTLLLLILATLIAGPIPANDIAGAWIALDRTSLLIEPGGTATVTATVGIDEPTDIRYPPVVWTTDTPGILEIESKTWDRRTVTLKAVAPVGATMVYADFGGARAGVSVSVASVRSGVTQIDTSWIESLQTFDVGEPGGASELHQTVRLASNKTTRGIRPGDLLIATGSDGHNHGLMMKVDRLLPSIGFGVSATGPVASLDQTFSDLQIRARGAAFDGSESSDEDAKKALGVGASALLDFECQVTSGDITLGVSGPAFSMPARFFDPYFDLDMVDGEVQRIDIGLDARINVSLSPATITAIGGGTIGFDCNLPLDAIPGAQLIDSVPVPNLPIEMTISPSLGVEGGLTMQAGQLTLGLGTLHFQLETRTGIHYDPTGGWSTVSERTGPSFTYEPPGFQGNVDIQLSVTGGLYAAIDLGLAPIGLGDFLDVKLLQVKAREQVDATVPIEAVLFPPTPPETRYENPTWKRSTVGEATLQLAFEGSGGEVLQEVLESISKKIPTNLNLLPPTLYSVTRVQGETPRLTVSSSYSAAPPHTAITFDIRARPFGDTEAFVLGGSEVELWGSRDGGVAVLLGVTTLDTVGNASITHTFGIEGDYEVLAQVYDGLTGRIGLPVLTNSTTLTIDGDVPPFLLDPQPVVMEGQPGDTIVETVDLISGATAPFDFSITPTPSFQSISPLSGTVQPSASETITLTVKCPDPQTSVSTKSNQNPPVSVPLRIDPDHDDSIEVVIDCGGGGGGGGGGGAGGGGGGSSDGDPHLVTFDGIPYDFQAKGEAILARSTHSADNFQVQARQEAWNSRPVTVNTAAAMAVGLDRVAFYVWPPTTGSNDLLLVNGQPEAIALGATFHLADGGRITRDGRTYTVHWPVDRGHRVAVQDHRSYLNIAVQPSILLEDQVEGVLGNFDGDPSNDFRLRDGTLLPAPPSFEQLYGCPDGIACFAYDAEGWINRDAAESLFDYVPGDGPAHYAPAPGTTYPTVQQTSADFPADDQNAARAQCEAAGITHPVLLESCMLDLLICDDDPDCDGMGLNGRDDLPIHDLGTIGLHAVEWEFECLSSFPTCVDSFFIDDYGIAGSDGHTVRLDSPGLWGETLFRTPATKDLGQDVSQQTYLRLRLRIDADDPPGYPWQVPFRITLYTNDNQALQYETSRNILVFDQWIDIRMPLSGGEDDDGWDWTLTSTGGVLTNINWIEILVDPYENPPTRFHFDQIFFE